MSPSVRAYTIEGQENVAEGRQDMGIAAFKKGNRKEKDSKKFAISNTFREVTMLIPPPGTNSWALC